MKKKNIKATTALLGLATSLTMSGCANYEYHQLEKQYEELNEDYEKLRDEYDALNEVFAVPTVANRYYKKDIKALISNDGKGNLTYHFVKEQTVEAFVIDDINVKATSLQSVTDPSLKYANREFSYEDTEKFAEYPSFRNIYSIQKSGDDKFIGWIPDNDIATYVINNLDNFTFPKKYCERSYFSKEELLEIEEYMNNYPLNLPDWFMEKTYKPENLSFVRVGDTGFIVDRSEVFQLLLSDDVKNPESQKRWHYYYSLTNPYRALRTETEVKEELNGYAHEEKCIVSLDDQDPYIVDDVEEMNIQDEIRELYPDISELTSANIQSLEEHILAQLKEETTVKKLNLPS